MIIDCISDLHGHYPQLEGGDLLIVAGDLTARDTLDEHLDFIKWCAWQSYKKIVYISGNHDNKALREPVNNKKIVYLCDSGTEFVLYPELEMMEKGKVYERPKFKIWGSPWTRRFKGMNPHCMAFTVDTEEELAEKWALIPDDVDILVTHAPPYDHLDHIRTKWNDREAVGSESLYWEITERIVPKIHIFGHIHESYGIEKREDFYPAQSSNFTIITYVNASQVNERYEPVNKPIRIEL